MALAGGGGEEEGEGEVKAVTLGLTSGSLAGAARAHGESYLVDAR